MSFSIESVELVNFRSYRGEHTFAFPTAPGLYALTGLNLDNTRLGRNGAGKSTLLDAIVWCLYGRTSRGLKASDVVTWGEKSCHVVMRLNVAGTVLGVARTQNPNSLAVNGKTVTEVDIGLTHEAFLHSVIMPQFGESFFDLSPAAKLTLFSEIMELDYWLDKSKAADTKAKAILADKLKAENSLARTIGQIDTVNDDLETYKQREAEFDADQAQIIKGYEKETKGVKDVETEIRKVRAVIRKAEERLADLAKQELCEACGQAVPNKDVQAIKRNKADFEAELQRHQRQFDRIHLFKEKIEEEKGRKSPYAKLISNKEDALVKQFEQIDMLKLRITKIEEEHVAVNFWVTGFKRVRLFIIEETLRQLEVEVNNCLGSLGLLNWRIEFDVERENKSGSVTKGFVVMIYPPGHSEPVRYESWSGGETQRLRLAGNIGLSNLIMERAGLVSQIEFFDEFSTHMGEEGILDTLQTLHDRAHNLKKAVWVIDHHSMDFGGFSGVLCVTKDGKGSKLEYGE